VPVAEEQVIWPLEEWLAQASTLLDDPIIGLLRGNRLPSLASASSQKTGLAGGTAAPPVGMASASLVALGQTLYAALFQGSIRDSWMTAQGIAQHRQEDLRLRLGLKGTQLHRLPWEILHAGDRPVTAGTNVIFSRYYPTFGIPAPIPPRPAIQPDSGEPLKILMVLSAPGDQEVLALRQEANHLQAELGVTAAGSALPEIELTILEQPDRAQLTQALEHNRYQVLHYAGHSNLGTSGGCLYLVSRRTGLTETLNGEDLAGLLVNNGIHMAVFNSCRGVSGATDKTKPEGDNSLAEALVRRGIPAVLAMAERIPDDVALNLSRLLYRNLKQGCPIDLSLGRARQGLISSYGSGQLYWALPILYLNPDYDGHLHNGSTNPTHGATFHYEEPLTDLDLEMPDLEVVPHEETIGLSPDDYFDPDSLEFDDLDYESDAQILAKLVQEASGGTEEAEELILRASPIESLLPQESLRSPQTVPSLSDYGKVASLPSNLSTVQPASVAELAKQVEKYMTGLEPTYLDELEPTQLSWDRLKAEIAAGYEAIQANPEDAEAYGRLGWALYRRGNLDEAIAAYRESLNILPTQAIVHNRLGLALYQQQNLQAAMEAFDRALLLDPSLMEAYRNLQATQEQHSSLTGTPVPPPPQPKPQTQELQVADRFISPDPNSLPSKAPTSLPSAMPLRSRKWLGLSAVVIPGAIIAGWIALQRLLPPPMPVPPPSPSVTVTNPVKQGSNEQLVALATTQLSQGKGADAATTIAELIQRNDLDRATTVLETALKTPSYKDDATFNFLMGKVLWYQYLRQNQPDRLTEIQRSWVIATRQPKPEYYTALGFLHYAKADWAQAQQSWKRARELITAATPLPELRQVELTAQAGLALAATKLANQEPPAKAKSLRQEAVTLSRGVLAADEKSFQPDALSSNWLWTTPAIKDWRSLLQEK